MSTRTEFQVLQGSTLVEDRGLEDEGRKVRCNLCDSIRILTRENAAGAYIDRWVCHTCQNNLLLEHDGELRQPLNCLYLTGCQSKSNILETGDAEYTVVKETSDELTDAHLAAYLMNREAKHRDFAIGTYNLGYHYPHVVLDDREAVAYLLWGPTPNDYMVLRQLFVRNSYRRQGIGSALVEYWWEDIAKEWCEDEDEDFYHIEGPNDEMRELIVSIPHDGEDGRPVAYEHHATAV